MFCLRRHIQILNINTGVVGKLTGFLKYLPKNMAVIVQKNVASLCALTTFPAHYKIPHLF